MDMFLLVINRIVVLMRDRFLVLLITIYSPILVFTTIIFSGKIINSLNKKGESNEDCKSCFYNQNLC
jgi:hypothetical protein